MIDEWLQVTLLAIIGGILALAFIIFFIRCFCRKSRTQFAIDTETGHQSLQNGIARLHQVSPNHEDQFKNLKYINFRSTKHFFNWSDHPSLINEAVENGWSQFAFTNFISSSSSTKSTRNTLLTACGVNDRVSETNIEIGWEVSEGSADFMQKIRLNPGLKRIIYPSSSLVAVSSIKTGLPLPGPNLENSSFPQQAYFEIMILPRGENLRDNSVDRKEKLEKQEQDRILLISDDFNAKNGPESLPHAMNSHSQRKSKVKQDGKNEGILLSVGLTGGGPAQLRFPGNYLGSIGFNSSGSVYLDGTKLVAESDDDEWGKSEKVIGCGYNPSQKKVFFTADSQLVHEIHCKTEEFGFPLYPTLAANVDITILVNFGQSPFKFAQANTQRTSNPCFIGSLSSSPSLGYEDSTELFSMGRIDAQWLQRSNTRSNNNTVSSIKSLEYDEESEGDLFEIVLDSTRPSPFSTGYR